MPTEPYALLATMLAFVAFFAAANWLAGGNMRWRKRFKLPGRSIYYAGLLAIAVGGLTYGWVGAAAGLNFAVWRLPGWYGAIDAGTMPAATPGQGKLLGFDMRSMRTRDYIVMSARGLLAFPFFVAAALMQPSLAPLIALGFASLLQGACYDIAHHFLGRRNDWAEIMAGAVWGVAYFVAIATAHQ